MKYHHFFFLLLPVLLLGCSKDKRYNVPPEVDVYVQRFIDEANARGLDMEISRLVVEFNDELSGPDNTIAGRCVQGHNSWRKPIIELSPDFYDFSPEVQEQLVFHELGHCILDRVHRDDKLPNGSFISTMNTHYWNYTGGQSFKREYYLDELFTVAPAAAAPMWVFNAASYSDVDVADKTFVLQEDFDDNSAGWTAPTGHTLSVSDGYMDFTTNTSSGGSVVANLNIPTNADYEILARLKIIKGDAFPTAIAWNPSDEFGIFGYNKENLSAIGALEFQNNYVSATPSSINSGSYNRLAVRKIGATMYYFLNEVLIDVQDVQNMDLDFAGIIIGDDASVQVDYLYVYTIN